MPVAYSSSPAEVWCGLVVRLPRTAPCPSSRWWRSRWGVAFLGERVAPAALLGTALVLAGAWLTSRREA
jgi:drug/metabolite transporter (DMT)-like permease